MKEEGREEEGGMNEARLVEEMGNSLGVGKKICLTPMKRLPEKYLQGNKRIDPFTPIGSRSDGGRGAGQGIGMMLSNLVYLVYYSTC